MISTYDDVKQMAVLSSGQVIRGFHKSEHCLGIVCPVHKPSQHVLSIFPLVYNQLQMHFYRNVFGTMVLDPDDYILNKNGKAITYNAAKCLSCNFVVESTFRHDYKACLCGNVFVDGGCSYLRHGYKYAEKYKDLSVIVLIENYSV